MEVANHIFLLRLHNGIEQVKAAQEISIEIENIQWLAINLQCDMLWNFFLCHCCFSSNKLRGFCRCYACNFFISLLFLSPFFATSLSIDCSQSNWNVRKNASIYFGWGFFCPYSSQRLVSSYHHLKHSPDIRSRLKTGKKQQKKLCAYSRIWQWPSPVNNIKSSINLINYRTFQKRFI